MRGTTRLVLVLPLLIAVPPSSLAAQDGCAGYGARVEQGWQRYRADDIDGAGRLFAAALQACPGPANARVGLGYVALRRGDLDEAERRFADALAIDSVFVDALVGSALVSWRHGDSLTSVQRFEAVRRVEPENAMALDYLGRLGARPPPERPPLVLPDTVEYHARAQGDRFEVLVDGRWRPFHVNGINLGAALPGRFPSEFPDSLTYAGWIAEMAAMSANTVRVYTIHPPHFYQALYTHNVAHPTRPLRVIHGVWTELPPDHDYRDSVWEGAFFAEMQRVVDLVHGRADLPRRAGHAFGHYTANVSPWVVAYLIGREWEPFSVADYDALRPADTVWHGGYVRVAGGTPSDAWMGRALDTLVAYETATYRTQRPVGYTNWPTLDPMHHPTETTASEEVAIRARQGERLPEPPREYDNDAVGLDATRLAPTPQFAPGIFAAFHAYPYYPDFMVLDPGYATARSPEGPSHYFGYLTELKARHPNMPVLIAEYGVPASRSAAHLQPQGWHHGGHTEAGMAEINARLTREIAAAGMAGGALFAWMDEWFKRNWLVTAFELPAERNRLWLNRLDPEQMYGVIAMEPMPAVPGATAAERADAWRAVPPLLETADGVLRAAADAGALWLRFEPAGGAPDEVQIAFDVVDSLAGAFTLAGSDAPPTRTGVEAVVRVTADTARVLTDPAVLQFVIRSVRRDFTTAGLMAPPYADAPAGYFTGRWAQEFNRPLRPIRRARGDFRGQRVVTNRLRFGRDGQEFAAAGYDRGYLVPGPAPDGDWERLPDGALELRLPWLLLNVSDPSSRHVLFDSATATGTEEFGTTMVDHIGITLGVRRGDTWTTRPAEAGVAPFTWATWDEPAWRQRRRPAFDAMRAVWEMLERDTEGGTR